MDVNFFIKGALVFYKPLPIWSPSYFVDTKRLLWQNAFANKCRIWSLHRKTLVAISFVFVPYNLCLKKEYVSHECAYRCTMAINADSLVQLKDVLVKSKRFVFLTGAGISQESGIPTFRGDDGVWKTHDPAKLVSLSSFLENPSLVWGYYSYRQKLISKCQPNPGHLSISKIEEQKKGDSWVLTQNVATCIDWLVVRI